MFTRMLTLLLVPGLASAQGVRNVTAPDGPAFTQIQPAIDAAAEGDALLVAEGEYEPFTIDGKSISIFAVPGAEVELDRQVTVKNLAAGQDVVLSGLIISPWPFSPTIYDPALAILQCEGSVQVQDCVLGQFWRNGDGNSFCYSFPVLDGGPGNLVQDSPRVAFLACQLYGGPGMNVDDTAEDCPGGTGGPGLRVENSFVALYDTRIRGGFGGSTSYYGTGHGGLGLILQDADVFASGGRILGGPGGIAVHPFPQGPGGDGAWLSETSTVRTLECDVIGLGDDALDVTGPGVLEARDGHARKLLGPAIVSSRDPVPLVFRGESGDGVWFPRTLQPGFAFLDEANGVWLTQFPPPALGETALRVPWPRARLSLALQPPSLASAPHGVITVQAFARSALEPIQAFGAPPGSAAFTSVLSSARVLLALDPEQGPDCNGNGVSDFLDVVEGTSLDANHDLVPDECELAD